MPREWKLMCFDNVLATFVADEDEFGSVRVRDLWVDPAMAALLPARLLCGTTARGMEAWLSSRSLPKDAAFVNRILEQAGLSGKSTMALLGVSKGLSTTDAYWVCREDESLLWRDINVFQNDLDAVLSLVAYTGVTSSQRHKAGMSTAWTTNGSYPKAWRRIDGELVLYKANNWPVVPDTAANRDHGPWSEFFCSQVADVIGLPHVSYGLDRWKGHIASTCRLLNSEDVSLVPFSDVQVGCKTTPEAMSLLWDLDSGWGRESIDMLVFDAIVCNDDRHQGNVALLRDNHTGEFLGLAPCFDNNRALFPTDMPADYDCWPRRPQELSPRGIGGSFDAMARAYLQDRHHEWARRLLDANLRQDSGYPEEALRFEALNSYLHERARQLLSMPTKSANELAETLERNMPEDATNAVGRWRELARD